MGATYASRVKRGAAYLDARIGRNWEKRIDPTTLDLQDGCECILAQVSESHRYLDGLNELGIKDLEDRDGAPKARSYLGFSETGKGKSIGEAFKRLTNAWLRLLAARAAARYLEHIKNGGK